MNKFKDIERDLSKFEFRFSHWSQESILNIKKKNSYFDELEKNAKNDKDALELLNNIEKNIEGYFSNIINKINFELIKNNSLNNYNNKLESIKRNYLKHQIDDQINSLNLKIINERNKYPLFIEIFKDIENTDNVNPSDNFKETIAKKSKELYLNSNLSPTDKILKIANYYINLSNFITKNIIFQKLKTPHLFVRFEDLFKSTELYNKAVNRLIENDFIEKGENKLYWIFIASKKFTAYQTIIALYVVLEKKQYFKQNPKTIYRNIKNEFGIEISESYYSRSSNKFKKDYDTSYTKNADYISLFKDIL